MRTLVGNHLQSATGRHFHYRVMYELLGNSEVYFGGSISEPSRGMFGSLERGASVDGTVPVGPDCVPVDLAIRSQVLSYIERTDFGEWRPPPPNWIGWRGPI